MLQFWKMTERLPQFDFRTANASDEEILLSWRNDPVTRAMSFNTDIVVLRDHHNWLEKSLNNPDRVLLIGLLENSPVGIVRFDMDSDKSSAEISVTLAPDVRGHHLGCPYIQSACNYYLNRLGRRIPIKAEIKPENIKSIKAFGRAGFKLQDTKEDRLVYTLEVV